LSRLWKERLVLFFPLPKEVLAFYYEMFLPTDKR